MLLPADGFAAASFTGYDLKTKIDSVSKCYKSWNLRCNLKKTKIMVSKKGWRL
jgi:hypothetical protein